jgi:sensor c-di-GMP phosphodiesterase-like protein
VSPRRKLLVAIAVGVVLAGPPVAAFNYWLSGLVERQGREDLELSARRHMALSEARVARVLTALDDLTTRAIDSCKPAHVDAMRQATFAASPIKELSIIGPDGRTLCTDVGNPLDQRRVVSSEPLSADSPILIETIRLGPAGESWVRFRKPGAGGANGIAALVPAALFVPQVSNGGHPMNFHARMLTARGTPVGESGELQDGADPTNFIVADFSSSRYALRAHITARKNNVAPGQSDLRAIGVVVSGLLAILILSLSVMMPRRVERPNPIADIERALGAGEFVPYFQPIVDIRSGRLRGAEVLVRWRKPDGTIVPPAMFIPLAESSGLIIELTRSLMRRVLQEAGAAIGKRPHLTVSFNLTARHFLSEEIVEDVRTIFKRSPVKLSQIVLEVTERQPIENLTETRRIVAALQGLGCKIAIDDVGTGHSGLSYMLKLGVDIIKIDKIFIDSIGTDRNSNTIIETLIDLAQNMRMDVVAEGVESFEQVVHLRELGIRAAQGYVFAPPLPAQAFLKLVEAIDPLKVPSKAAAKEQAKETTKDVAEPGKDVAAVAAAL